MISTSTSMIRRFPAVTAAQSKRRWVESIRLRWAPKWNRLFFAEAIRKPQEPPPNKYTPCSPRGDCFTATWCNISSGGTFDSSPSSNQIYPFLWYHLWPSGRFLSFLFCCSHTYFLQRWYRSSAALRRNFTRWNPRECSKLSDDSSGAAMCVRWSAILSSEVWKKLAVSVAQRTTQDVGSGPKNPKKMLVKLAASHCRVTLRVWPQRAWESVIAGIGWMNRLFHRLFLVIEPGTWIFCRWHDDAHDTKKWEKCRATSWKWRQIFPCIHCKCADTNMFACPHLNYYLKREKTASTKQIVRQSKRTKHKAAGATNDVFAYRPDSTTFERSCSLDRWVLEH